MKIIIITGGTTSERKISLISAKYVKKALESIDHKVKLYDLNKGKITKNLVKNFDIVFPVLHGEEGEGGDLQRRLSILKVPFVGGDWKGFKIGWHKIPFKKFCKQEKIITAQWTEVKNKDNLIKFGFPSVLKSSNGGSSKEVVILKSKKDLKKSKKLFNSSLPLLVEKYLPGIEVTVGILNDKALPVLEIIPPNGGWFDYKNKYSGQTQEIPNAPSLSSKLQLQVQRIALQIHQKLDLGPYSRIDFIVSDNIPYVLEINTIPGLTAQSLFPKAGQAAGISFPELLDQMIKMAHLA